MSFTAVQLSAQQWQYNYNVAGAFSSGDDLAIYFPIASSSALVDLGTGGADWTTDVFQPDAALPADGEFDLVATVDNPSLSPVFSVQFLFSGSGTPGAQAFSLYDPSFTEIGSGTTQPAMTSPVPEPGSLMLLGSGALAMVGLRRRRS